MNMAFDHSSLIEAYRILGRLAQDAWANPQEVPLPIARVLLHARDHVGAELSTELLGPARAGITTGQEKGSERPFLLDSPSSGAGRPVVGNPLTH